MIALGIMETARTPQHVPVEGLTARHILVVDDSKPMRLFTQRLLELTGARVDCADDGEQALRCASAASYDLMLIDIEMPGIDGCDVARRLRSVGDRTPIVAVTAHLGEVEHDRCLASGFDACLTKPFSKAKLLSVVTPLIQGTKPSASSGEPPLT